MGALQGDRHDRFEYCWAVLMLYVGCSIVFSIEGLKDAIISPLFFSRIYAASRIESDTLILNTSLQ